MRGAAGTDWTFDDLAERVDHIAAGLRAGGVGEGWRVAVALANSPEAVVTLLAVIAVDATLVVANHSWWPRDLRTALDRAEVDLFIGDGALTAAVSDICLTATPPIALPRDGLSRRSRRGHHEIEMSLIALSAGSRGEPYPVGFSRDQVRAWSSYDSPPAGASLIVTTELGHLPTLRRVLVTLAAGGCVELRPRWRESSLLDHLRRTPQASLWCSAPQLEKLVIHANGQLPSLISIEACSAHLHRRTAEAWRSAGAFVRAWYTFTEAGGLVASAVVPAAGAIRHSDSFATAAPGIVVTAGSKEFANGMVFRGPAVGADVRATPNGGTSRLIAEGETGYGWLSGDFGQINDTGNIRLDGRLGDRFFVRDQPVDPLIVEAAIMEHPGIGSVILVPRPDPSQGTIPVAVVVASDPDQPPFLSDLRDCLRGLPEHVAPQAQWVTETLPLTSAGGPNRRLLTYEEASR